MEAGRGTTPALSPAEASVFDNDGCESDEREAASTVKVFFIQVFIQEQLNLKCPNIWLDKVQFENMESS